MGDGPWIQTWNSFSFLIYTAWSNAIQCLQCTCIFLHQHIGKCGMFYLWHAIFHWCLNSSGFGKHHPLDRRCSSCNYSSLTCLFMVHCLSLLQCKLRDEREFWHLCAVTYPQHLTPGPLGEVPTLPSWKNIRNLGKVLWTWEFEKLIWNPDSRPFSSSFLSLLSPIFLLIAHKTNVFRVT